MEANLIQYFQQLLKFNTLVAKRLDGGDVNEVYLLKGNDKSFVVKLNNKEVIPDLFEKEARGLGVLTASKTIKTPKVIKVGSYKTTSFLLLEYIEPSVPKGPIWETLGVGLAKMHKTSKANFGLDHSNYIGPLEQINDWTSSWEEFFITKRLEVQLRITINAGGDRSLIKGFSNLFSRLENLFPKENPSLLHGDLWSGNLVKGEEPCLIDPAIYYGNREMDLAMTKLFGGFEPRFYAAYSSEFELEKSWEERVDLWNLYPLMVHLNLFGGSYVHQIKSILSRF